MVVVILAIMAMTIGPRLSSRGIDVGIRAQQFGQELRLLKELCASREGRTRIIAGATPNEYQFQGLDDTTNTWSDLSSMVNSGLRDLGNNVTITPALTAPGIQFDNWGRLESPTGTGNPSKVTFTVQHSGGETAFIDIYQETGYISVRRPQ
jgi:hypothetical protein